MDAALFRVGDSNTGDAEQPFVAGRERESDRRCVHAPRASDTGAGTGNLRFLRDPAGHAAALVTEIAGKCGGMAMQAGALSAGAEMGEAIGDDEIARIEQRSFAHALIIEVPGWA